MIRYLWVFLALALASVVMQRRFNMWGPINNFSVSLLNFSPMGKLSVANEGREDKMEEDNDGEITHH